MPRANPDHWLMFVAFNQDISRQFGTIQRRLGEEPMIGYINSIPARLTRAGGLSGVGIACLSQPDCSSRLFARVPPHRSSSAGW